MSKKKKQQKKIETKLIAIFNKTPKKKYNYKQLASQLKINDTQGRNSIIRALQKLKARSFLLQNDAHQFYLNKQISSSYEGVFSILSSGKGIVKTDRTDEEVLISKKHFGTALHGDRVLFYYRKSSKFDASPTGEILSVEQRAPHRYVGILQKQKQFGFVVIQNNRVPVDFFVEKEHLKGYNDGDKVVIEFTEWLKQSNAPTGKIIKSLGKPGEAETEIHAILHDYHLPYEFSDAVNTTANSINRKIESKEIKKRKDFRDTLTFTIDPITAKDFDDALSFKVLDDNLFEVGIHIADVSHYVREDSLLDQEAYDRATSVYLVDRVVPMLPEVLSNGVCSLRPNEEKYTFSAVFTIDGASNIKDQWFGKTVICSDHRFAYEEVQEVLENDHPSVQAATSLSGASYTLPDATFQALKQLDRMAKIIRGHRMKNGAISFDRVEVNFQLNAQNHPETIFFKTSKDAHKLIEEFMLLANRKVAEFIGKIRPELPFVYRVHDSPDTQKLFDLKSTISTFGYQLNLNGKNINKSLNKLLLDCSGTREQNLIDTLTLRCMSKAAYTTQNIGHYGLAFDYYTHFTSPIRRYPDVIVHRLLEKHLNGKKPSAASQLEEVCRHSSDRELLATKAERDSVKYMQIVFMQDKIGKQFKGVISGVTERGIYVEIIENKCEGMIRLSDISNDYFIFNERDYSVRGKRTNQVYQLGDTVDIVVKKANVLKRHLDFMLV